MPQKQHLSLEALYFFKCGGRQENANGRIMRIEVKEGCPPGQGHLRVQIGFQRIPKASNGADKEMTVSSRPLAWADGHHPLTACSGLT